MANGGSILLDQKDLEEKRVVVDKNPNSLDERAIVLDLTTKVNEMFQLHRRTWREFNDRTLMDYIDDNEKRINNYVPPREEDLDDWQTKGFEGITREKMLAFVSKVATRRPRYKFRAVKKDGFFDRTVAEVVEDFHTYSWLTEDPTSVQFFFDAWEAAGHGTVIRYEGVEEKEDVEEDFDLIDLKTGEVKGLRESRKLLQINCKARKVRLADFLIPDWYESDIQKQPYLAETAIFTRQKFDQVFGEYKNADKIPDLKNIRDDFGETFYMQQWDGIVQEGIDKVHVTYFYRKGSRRKFFIIANGVLIAALPFPRKDGLYPYAKGIFKPFADSNFFYGKALPDEIAWDQDIYNAFKNMVIDRSILHIQRPMVTDAANEFADVFMSPSKILTLKGNVTQLDIAPPGVADIQILEFLRASINRQSSDSQQSGQIGSGVTAREIVIADENARKLAGVFRLFLEAFDLDATRLRVGNILQFYFEPIKLTELLDDGKQTELSLVYRTASLPSQRLSDGKNGTKIIQLVGSSSELPLREDIEADELASHWQGIEMEKLVLQASYVKNYELDVLPVPESTYESSRSLALALENEYQTTVAKLYPQQFQQYSDVFFRQLNEIYEKDMTDFENTRKTQGSMMQAQSPQAQPAGSITQALGTGQPTLARLSGLQL